MNTFQQRRRGFTIVELLIVIVVIGILAAITIVTYNGIQNKANNSRTATALGAWIKAMTLYKVDNGHWPRYATCLGTDYTYGVSGDDTSGVGQCRQDSTANGFVENATFENDMKTYLNGSLPTPAFVTARSSDTLWRRGLSLYYGGGDGTQVYIIAIYAGQDACPVVRGFSASRSVYGGNDVCNYLIGHISDT